MRGRLYTLLLGVFYLLATASSASAQQATGQIFGKATDDTGGVLPGVTVTLTGPALLQPLSSTTSSTGTYQFPSLQIGTYAVKFEMAGFKTIVNEGIQISVGFSAQVNAAMGVSTVQETVTVSGEAPIVDTRKTGTGSTFTKDQLEKIPTSRDPWVIMEQTPSISLDRANVGGTQSGQQSGIVARGMGSGNNVWRLDGVNITDMNATGASTIYFDFSTFEEMTFSTSGNDVTMQTGGVGVNLVTKSGTDKFRTSARYLITDEKFESFNVDDSLRAQKASAGNPIQQVKEYGVDAGGPIMRGRAWFYGAYGKQDINVGIVNFYLSQAGCPTSSTDPLATTLDKKALRDCLRSDTTTLDTYTMKGNVLVRQGNTATWFSNYNKKFRNARDASATRPPETVVVQNGPVWSHKASDQQIFSDRWLADAQFAYVGGGFDLDFPDPATQFGLQRMLNETTSIYNRSFSQSLFKRPLWSLDLRSTYFLPGKLGGDHSFKFGYEYRNAPASTYAHIGGFVTARFSTLAYTPVSADMHRDNAAEYELKTQALYLQDTYTKGRWTATLGLRYDRQHEYLGAATVEANPIIPDLLPAASFNGLDPGFTFNTLSPRFGLTYDLSGGNGRTVASFLGSRYYGQQGTASNITTTLNPLNAVTLRYAWKDLNGDQLVTRNELDLSRILSQTGNYNPANPGSPTTINTVDPDMKIDTTDEIVAGLQHQVAPNLAIAANYIWRRYDNFQSFVIPSVPGSAYEQITYTPPATKACYSGGGTQVACPQISYFQPTIATAGLPRQLINTPDFNRSYSGIELSMTKRYSNRWMAYVGFSYNDSQAHWTNANNRVQTSGSGGTTFNDPTNIDKLNDAQWAAESGGSGVDNVWVNAKWLLRVSGMYSLPYEVNVSAFLNTRQGYLFPVAFQQTGRTNGADNINVILEPYGETRHPNFAQLDLMFERPVRLKQLRLRPTVGIFNLTNANTVMARTRLITDPNYLNVTQVLAPRVVQFGIKADF